MKDEVIDLTGASEHIQAPPIVTPNNSYNSYSLSMTFWENNEEETTATNSNDDLNALRITPTNTYSRTMRLVLIYLRGEQDKFRGITEARGDHWRNSWSAAIRSITNYWHVYGKHPNWWGRVDSYLFGVGKAIREGIRQFLEDIGEVEEVHAAGPNVTNATIVDMLKREGHYRAAKAIRTWTDECGLTYRISSKRIFKTAAGGISLEAKIASFLTE